MLHHLENSPWLFPRDQMIPFIRPGCMPFPQLTLPAEAHLDALLECQLCRPGSAEALGST